MISMREAGKDTLRILQGVRDLAARERRRLMVELSDVQGLMPLLMKPRNHMRWSLEDKRLLRRHLKQISRLSPYLVLLVAPGGFFALPALAWWLDRRRSVRASSGLPCKNAKGVA